jgi:hypothetical protein
MLQGIAALMVAQGQVSTIIPVQKKAYASTVDTLSTHSIVPNSTPTTGNLLILCVVSDTTITGTPSGWSVVNSAVFTTGTYMYWKVSAGNETTISVTISTTDSCCLGFLEYSGLSTLDKTNSAEGSLSSIPTGTTATTTAANELIVTLAGISSGSAGTAPTTVSSWSNGQVTTLSASSTGASDPNIGMDIAVQIVSVTGAYTSTATTVANSTNPSGIIGTFK